MIFFVFTEEYACVYCEYSEAYEGEEIVSRRKWPGSFFFVGQKWTKNERPAREIS